MGFLSCLFNCILAFTRHPLESSELCIKLIAIRNDLENGTAIGLSEKITSLNEILKKIYNDRYDSRSASDGGKSATYIILKSYFNKIKKENEINYFIEENIAKKLSVLPNTWGPLFDLIKDISNVDKIDGLDRSFGQKYSSTFSGIVSNECKKIFEKMKSGLLKWYFSREQSHKIRMKNINDSCIAITQNNMDWDKWREFIDCILSESEFLNSFNLFNDYDLASVTFFRTTSIRMQKCSCCYKNYKNWAIAINDIWKNKNEDVDTKMKNFCENLEQLRDTLCIPENTNLKKETMNKLIESIENTYASERGTLVHSPETKHPQNQYSLVLKLEKLHDSCSYITKNTTDWDQWAKLGKNILSTIKDLDDKENEHTKLIDFTGFAVRLKDFREEISDNCKRWTETISYIIRDYGKSTDTKMKIFCEKLKQFNDALCTLGNTELTSTMNKMIDSIEKTYASEREYSMNE